MIKVKANGNVAAADVFYDLDAGTVTVSVAKPGSTVSVVGASLDLAMASLRNHPFFTTVVAQQAAKPEGPSS